MTTSRRVQWHHVPWIILAILVGLMFAYYWYAREFMVFEEPHAAIVATNHTETTLSFRLFANGKGVDLPLRRLQPGQTDTVLSGGSLWEPSTITEDGCTEGDLVAIAPDGSEVARHLPPLCDGDRWVVTDE